MVLNLPVRFSECSEGRQEVTFADCAGYGRYEEGCDGVLNFIDD